MAKRKIQRKTGGNKQKMCGMRCRNQTNKSQTLTQSRSDLYEDTAERRMNSNYV